MAKTFFEPIMRKLGYIPDREWPRDFTESGFRKFCKICKPHTRTGIERMFALHEATKYIVQHDIPGAIVECGVWQGGSCMLCALTLLELGVTDRSIYLYDTFKGMSEPTDEDVDHAGRLALERWEQNQSADGNKWQRASLELVKKNMFSTEYPQEKIVFVEGKVEDTIPGVVPDQIAILRLDTDWYESTHHEFVHLFPKLSQHGILLLDDYGHWEGARKATDEYLKENGINMFLSRIDHTARLGVKP